MFRRFRKPPDAPILELTLSTLTKGCMVDYDLETFEVAARNHYRYEGGVLVTELELRSADRVLYLEREEDDEVTWSVSEKIDPDLLLAGGEPASAYVVRHDVAPSGVELEGEEYGFEEDAAAFFHREGAAEGVPMVAYGFAHADGVRFVTLERWGETKFEAARGRSVRELDFTHLLPAPDPR